MPVDRRPERRARTGNQAVRSAKDRKNASATGPAQCSMSLDNVQAGRAGWRCGTRTTSMTDPALVPETDVSPDQRLAAADAVVRRYATYSAFGGLIPVPFVDVA